MLALALILALCDLGLIAWLLRERKAHRMSRTALQYWRNRHAVSLDAAARISDVHTPGVRRVRVSPARGRGGVA